MSTTTLLILILAIAVGCVAYCIAKLTQIHDEQGEPQEAPAPESAEPPVWDEFELARRRYEASIEAWMTEKELVERRDL